jgi:hypothetical protein
MKPPPPIPPMILSLFGAGASKVSGLENWSTIGLSLTSVTVFRFSRVSKLLKWKNRHFLILTFENLSNSKKM